MAFSQNDCGEQCDRVDFLIEENIKYKTNVKMALSILESWSGYQDRIIAATKILKNLEDNNHEK